MSARTIIEAFRTTVASAPERVAVRTIDDSVSLTWGALATRVDALAGGLVDLGVQRGHTVAIMLSNRPEFHLADLAVMTIGATPFSIYQTLSPEQIEYVVGDAGARVVIVEPAFLKAILTARKNLPRLEHVIVVDGDGGTTTLAAVEGSNPSFDAVAAGRAVTPDDLLTLIYTSGTTGPPKGVQLTHRNLIACAEALQTIVQFPEGARVI
ncbi:MAG TPA: AMP-binding protein, partial [Candidatus Binatia bacterium]|nr:AMP-binding protein [Candidatus Binatia bacterium]